MTAGVGYCAVFIAFYVSFYYNVIIGWSLYYVSSSFSWELPWSGCDHSWNTEYCSSKCYNNETNAIPCNLTRSPAKEYFKLVHRDRSSHIDSSTNDINTRKCNQPIITHRESPLEA